MFPGRLRTTRLLPTLCLLLFYCAAGVARTNTPNSHLFPLPDALRSNVEFWKNIYAKHSEREVVIHDSWDLGIVYEVVNLDELVGGAKVSSRIEWKKVEQVKQRYAEMLLKLAARRRIDSGQLNDEEKRVLNLFGGKASSKQLRTAAKRIRGQSGLRDRFRRGLEKSGMYMGQIEKIFQEEGVPAELTLLPHVESSFNYNAYSKLGAAGLWQFTRSTGRLYMKIDYTVDERLDPIVATRSAARLLKSNYNMLGSWPLAITAYNHGPNGMKRAKRKFGTDIAKIVRHYRSRSFGFASRNFYSEFLAAVEVATNHEVYFRDVKFASPQQYIEFQLPHYIDIRSLLEKIELELEEFASHNPALRSPVLEGKRRIPKDYRVRVPFRDDLDMRRTYAGISSQFKFDRQVTPDWHKVRSGETLHRIARKYGVDVRELVVLNNIGNAHRIFAGQNLQIPDGKRPASITVVKSTEQALEEPRLADASHALAKPEGILDVPSTRRAVPDVGADVAPRDGSKAENEKPSSSLPPKPLATDLSRKHNLLASVEVRRIESRYESVEDVMAMALPGYHVEMNRDMDLRVVRRTKHEIPEFTFRGIDIPQNGRIRIEPDETLGHIADWLDVQTYKLRRINNLGASSSIQIGQDLQLTFERVTPEEFHRRRIEFHQGIEEDFYRNFVVRGEQVYKVRPGENIWVICNRTIEIPHWLIKKHNSGKRLTSLMAGEELIIPIVEARASAAILSE